MCGVGATTAIPNTNVAGASGGGATSATAPTTAPPTTAPAVPGSAVAGATGGGATLPVGATGALGGASALAGADTAAITNVLTSLVGVLNQLVQVLQNGALGGGALGGGAPGKTPVQSPVQATPVQGGGGNQVTGTMTAVGTDSISVRDAAGTVQTLKVEAGSVVAGKLEHLKEHLALNWGVNVTVENRNGVSYATNVADNGAKPGTATGGGAAAAPVALAGPVAAAAHDESVPHGH